MLIVQRLEKLCWKYRLLAVHINCFSGSLRDEDSEEVTRRLQAACHSVSATAVSGMKALFWRRALPPLRAAQFDFIWLPDADLAVDRFDLSRAIGEMVASNASLAQPRIAAGAHRNARASDWPLLRVRTHRAQYPSNCSAVNFSMVETQSPIFRRAAWSTVHRELLSKTPSYMLHRTVWGISEIWCGLLQRFSTRHAYAVLRSSVVHLDTHLIELAHGMNTSSEKHGERFATIILARDPGSSKRRSRPSCSIQRRSGTEGDTASVCRVPNECTTLQASHTPNQHVTHTGEQVLRNALY